MLFAVTFIDQKLKIDDPVGAISVHGVCGLFGTLMVGFFSTNGGLFYGGGWSLVGSQLIGIVICSIVVLSLAYITFATLNKTIGLRVEKHEEINGLDTIEHGISAYIDL